MTNRDSETPEERIARYIRLAGEARDLAARSKRLDRREECLTVAESWLAMAHGSEAANPPKEPEEPPPVHGKTPPPIAAGEVPSVGAG